MITAHHLVFGRKAILKNEGLILDLPLQNNFTDTTGINTMVAGGTSNLPTFTLEGGEYAATFNGSQSIKTNANFVIGTDKVSISFWIKRTSTHLSFISELSSNSDSKNGTFYVAFLNATTTLRVGDRTPDNTRDVSVTTNIWKHIVIVIDRALDANNTTKIYIDGIRQSEAVIQNNNTSGNYINDILFIGQRGGNSSGFIGQIKFFKIFNYPLSTTEITNLYNKTM